VAADTSGHKVVDNTLADTADRAAAGFPDNEVVDMGSVDMKDHRSEEKVAVDKVSADRAVADKVAVDEVADDEAAADRVAGTVVDRVVDQGDYNIAVLEEVGEVDYIQAAQVAQAASAWSVRLALAVPESVSAADTVLAVYPAYKSLRYLKLIVWHLKS
jgi:hypothetical protein